MILKQFFLTLILPQNKNYALYNIAILLHSNLILKKSFILKDFFKNEISPRPPSAGKHHG